LRYGAPFGHQTARMADAIRTGVMRCRTSGAGAWARLRRTASSKWNWYPSRTDLCPHLCPHGRDLTAGLRSQTLQATSLVRAVIPLLELDSALSGRFRPTLPRGLRGATKPKVTGSNPVWRVEVFPAYGHLLILDWFGISPFGQQGGQHPTISSSSCPTPDTPTHAPGLGRRPWPVRPVGWTYCRIGFNFVAHVESQLGDLRSP